MIENKIFSYLSYIYDECGYIPSEDEVYEQFQREFDNGVKFDVAQATVQQFVDVHDLSGIEIKWEGEIDGICIRRDAKSTKVQCSSAARKLA